MPSVLNGHVFFLKSYDPKWVEIYLQMLIWVLVFYMSAVSCMPLKTSKNLQNRIT